MTAVPGDVVQVAAKFRACSSLTSAAAVSSAVVIGPVNPPNLSFSVGGAIAKMGLFWHCMGWRRGGGDYLMDFDISCSCPMSQRFPHPSRSPVPRSSPSAAEARRTSTSALSRTEASVVVRQLLCGPLRFVGILIYQEVDGAVLLINVDDFEG